MSDQKILILPDVHLRHERCEKIIASVKPDKIIFLGDFWDDFGDNPEMIRETSEWFCHSINQKNRIHICGNHDVHYWFSGNQSLRCSGYEQFKSMIINDIVKKKDWEKLVFFYNLDDKWLLSHGGLHPSWVVNGKFNSGKIIDYSIKKAHKKLSVQTELAKKSFYNNTHHWFAMPGFSRCRGMSPYYGGILWCDWDREFHAMRGLNQIVGHTPQYDINWIVVREGEEKMISIPLKEVVNPSLSKENSYNICLDSEPGSRFYAIYENENLSIHNAEK